MKVLQNKTKEKIYDFHRLYELNLDTNFFAKVAEFVDIELPCRLPTKVALEDMELVHHINDEGVDYWVLEIPIHRD